MKCAIITVLPEILTSFFSSGIIHRAIEKGLFTCSIIPLRNFADPPHYNVDDTPFGGGAGMVLKPEPTFRAIIAAKASLPNAKVIYLTPTGRVFNQSMAAELAEAEELIFLCGRYEGVDQRVIDLLVDDEISIGDYILMGGEVACLAVIEATVRLRPGVLGNAESAQHESFTGLNPQSANEQALLEAPHYTKPRDFLGVEPPAVLLSGDHGAIARWRHNESVERTRKKRPDLLKDL